MARGCKRLALGAKQFMKSTLDGLERFSLTLAHQHFAIFTCPFDNFQTAYKTTKTYSK